MRKFATTACVVLCLMGSVLAQENTLTFEEAARIALEQNIGLRQQQNNRMNAEANVTRRFGQFTPSLEAGASGDVSQGLTFNQIAGELTTQVTYSSFGYLSARYTLFNGFGRQSLYKQAQQELARQQQLTSRQEEVVLFDLASQYLQVLLDQELTRIAQQNLTEQKDNLRVIAAQVEAGIRPISDKYDTEATIQNLEISLLEAKNAQANDEAVLLQTLQLEPGKPFTLVKPAWDLEALKSYPLDLQPLYEQALISRADYQAQKSAISASQYSVRAAKAAYSPRVSLSANVFSRYTSLFTDAMGNTIPYFDQFRNNVQTGVGLDLTIPIYNQLATRSSVQQAKVVSDNEDLSFQELERIIFTEVQRSTLNFRTAQQALTAAQAQLVAAEKAFEIQDERMRLGNTDLLTYNQSNTNLVRSKAELVQAEYRLMFQQLLLDYFVGKLDVSSFRE